MLRPDFFDLVGYAIEHRVGVKFSTNGTRIDRARAERLAAMDYLDVQISLDGATAEVNDPVRGAGSYAAARPAMDHLAAAGFGPFKISVVVTRHNVGAARRAGGAGRSLRRAAPGDAAAPVGSGRRHVGGAAPDSPPAALPLRLAARAPRRADRRLLLPPLGPRRAPRGAEPLRRGPGGLPDRPRRRRLRVPVRDPRGVPGGQRPGSRRLQPRSGALRALRRRSASPPAPVRARRAAPTTPVAAAAWPPSSSPACPSTDPIPSASSATARSSWPRSRRPPRGRPPTTPARAPVPVRLVSSRLTARRPSPPGPRWPPPPATACWWCPSAPTSSTAPTSRSTPTPGSQWPSPTRSPTCPSWSSRHRSPIGASGEHAGFPGTLSIGTEVLADVLVELVRSARGTSAGVVFALARTAGTPRASRPPPSAAAPRGTGCYVWGAAVDGGDAHAGRTETSLMMAIAPDEVRRSALEAGRTEPLERLWGELRSGGVRSVSPNGVLGDPPLATAAEGRLLLGALVDELSSALETWWSDVVEASAVSPVAVVTGAARGIGAATVDLLVADGFSVVAVDSCADDPAIGYPLATPGGSRRAGWRGTGSGSPPWSATCAARPTWTPRWPRRSGALRPPRRRRGGGRGHRRRRRRSGRSATRSGTTLFDVNVHGVRRPGRPRRSRRSSTAPEPRAGRVVAVASAAGLLGLRRLGGYVASKHAVIGLVRALAADLAGTGVTANAVCPGSTRTPMLDASARHLRPGLGRRSSPVTICWSACSSPRSPQRWSPGCAGPTSSGVTGAALPADGGMTAF